jgi:hypothetical protein
MTSESVKFQAKLEKFDSNLWTYHFKVPADIAAKFIEGENRRTLVRINEEITIQAALIASKEGWCILLNKKVRNQLDLQIGNSFNVLMEKDTSEYGMEMPMELSEVFSQEEYAWQVFKSLTPGKQRALIYLVLQVKNTDSRIRKSLAISEHLKESKGQLDFKKLNGWIKHYNNLK